MTNELNFDSIELMNTVQASFDYSELENPMGERCKDALRLDFDRKLKVELTLVDQPLKTQLEYRVIALNKAGEGSPSNTVMAML